MKISNARSEPKRFFGLHMCEGVAEYAEPGKEPYRIFVGEEAIKKMDPSFEGRPLYVQHVDQVDMSKFESEAAGVVVRSFYNAIDGKHWAEFIVWSDAGIEALSKKWVLSNSYQPTQKSGGGEWHGVQFAYEVMNGTYDHLAIVPNPRYAESIVLTPEEFKQYNLDKEQELKRIANAKGEPMLKLFKRSKVDNSADFENMVVELPKSKKEKTLTQLVNEADEHEMSMADCMANGDHHIMVGNTKMKVNDLVKKYQDSLEAMKAHNDDEGEEESEDNAGDEDEAKKLEIETAEKKKNEDEEKAKKEKEEKKANAKAKADALKNANQQDKPEEGRIVEMDCDRVQRGKARYGA